MTKVLAVDIDGTLIEKGHEMHEENRKALNRLMKDDFLVGLASGRQTSAIDGDWKEWGLDREFDFYIGMNGAMLRDVNENKNIDCGLMSFDQAKRIAKHLEHLNLSTNYYCEDDISYILHLDEPTKRSMERNKNKKFKFKIIDDIEEIAHLKIYRVLFRIEEEDMHLIQEYVAEHPFPEEFEGFRTDHECYEVMLSGVSKGKALEDYCTMKGLTLNDAYAFGDTSNDVAMLKVSHGVCLANGTKDAMDVSEYITDKRCEEGGFADFVNKFFYNEKSE